MGRASYEVDWLDNLNDLEVSVFYKRRWSVLREAVAELATGAEGYPSVVFDDEELVDLARSAIYSEAKKQRENGRSDFYVQTVKVPEADDWRLVIVAKR